MSLARRHCDGTMSMMSIDISHQNPSAPLSYAWTVKVTCLFVFSLQLELIVLAIFVVILQQLINWGLPLAAHLCWKFLLRREEVEVEPSTTISRNTPKDSRGGTQDGGGRKFYAVRQGYKPELYHSWVDCESQVKGFSNCEYKSFRVQEDAERYLRRV